MHLYGRVSAKSNIAFAIQNSRKLQGVVAMPFVAAAAVTSAEIDANNAHYYSQSSGMPSACCMGWMQLAILAFFAAFINA